MAEQSGFSFDASGNLMVVSAGVAVAPFTYINSIKFDSLGRVVVTP